MIKNHHKDDDMTSRDSSKGISAANKPQKEINGKDNNASSLIEDIRRSDFQDHNLLMYPDLSTFREIYSECTKQSLNNNEIVFLVTTYDSFDRIEDALRSKGISVDNEKKDGNLIIVDSVRAYQLDAYGAIKLAKSLVSRASRGGKTGVFNMSDLGSFFLSERVDKLVEYERSIPKKMDFKFKATRSYHKDNFGTLTREQQRALLLAHNSVTGVQN
jgi:hypothetical protein